MIKVKMTSLCRAGGVAVVLVLMADVLLSLYKVAEFGAAIETDFGLVVLVYLGVALVVALTGIGVVLGLGPLPIRNVARILYAAIVTGTCLLLINLMKLSAWVTVALENKTATLAACILLSGLVLTRMHKRGANQEL